MAVYISSNSNRFYCGAELTYGQVPNISSDNRMPAVKLSTKQQIENVVRKDKTGSRTFGGLPTGGRRRTTFQLDTYMTSWFSAPSGPSYGPLFQASLGSQGIYSAGGTIASVSGTTVTFSGPHGLSVGQAVAYSGDIRFVASIINASSIQVNAAFSTAPGPGASTGATMTYFPSTELPSVSVFDYWSPNSAVHRILCGAGIDQMIVKVNGDFHEFEFQGLAQDLIDSSTFSGEIGQLTTFPDEPALGAFDYSIVSGNLGQVWMGALPERFFTLTSAELLLDNALDVRSREFGFSVPRALSPGTRAVSLDFDLYEQDDDRTKGLYQAATQRSPINVMLQLGQEPGQLFGAYLKSVLPEVPEFDDGDNRLKWQFKNSRAQGTIDDEITVAFG